MGLLAELTHRCPLQCPYCSNPLELERANGELDDRGMVPGARRGGRARRAAAPSVRRRADRAPRPRADRRPCPRAGLYTNLITAGVLLDERADCAACARPGSTTSSSACRQPTPRPPTGSAAIADGHAKKLAVGAARARGRAAADRQRRRASAEPRPARGDDRPGAGARRPSARGGACPVLRLGAAEPRGADADPRAARGRDRDRRARAPRRCAGGSPSTM